MLLAQSTEFYAVDTDIPGYLAESNHSAVGSQRHYIALNNTTYVPACPSIGLAGMRALLRFLGDNQQHFHPDILPILRRWPELPLGERIQHKLPLCELGRKQDRQRLEAAGLIHKPVNHKGIGIDCAGRDVGPYDVIRPGRVDVRDVARGSRIVSP